MDGGQEHDVLDRIEAALARIERATAALVDRREALISRHATLREAVAETLSDLDALIDAGQPGHDA
jgi:hypothetical protein